MSRLLRDNFGQNAFFVITKDRPEHLRRVLSELDTERSKKGPLIFVLDSSTTDSAEGDVLDGLNQAVRARVVRLAGPELIRDLSSLFPEAGNAIGPRSAPIAQCRNVVLLVAAGLGITEACFLDDDVTGFDKSEPYSKFLRGLPVLPRNRVTGVNIGGVDSRDHITSLTTAFYNLTRSKECHQELSRERLIAVNSDLSESPRSCQKEKDKLVDHVSGGFVCSSLDYNKTLPFPPVYNEFWIWCFLQSRIHQTSVRLSRSWISHQPPLTQAVMVDSIVDEQIGIFFYKLLRTLGQRLTTISNLLGPPMIPMGVNSFSPYERVLKILATLMDADADDLRRAYAVVGLDKRELDDKLMGYLQSIDPTEIAGRLWTAYAQQIKAFCDTLGILRHSRAVMEELCLARVG